MIGLAILLVYVGLFAASALAIKLTRRGIGQRRDFTSLKTVTFGDESAIRPDRAASVISIVVVFLLWGRSPGRNWYHFMCLDPLLAKQALPMRPRLSMAVLCQVLFRYLPASTPLRPPPTPQR